MRKSMIALLIVALGVTPALSQEQKGATVFGTVRDSIGQPVADADVVLRPGNNRTRSDSLGNYQLTGLDDGNYAIAARKVGYTPDRWDIKVSKNGRLEVKFKLVRRTQLDTVKVIARRDCPAYTLDGFACRQRSGGGIFLDYPDIDDKRPTYTADIFRDIPGFRVIMRRTALGGVVPVPVIRNGFGCISHLVNGRPPTPATPVPQLPSDLSAVEIYMQPDSVPEPYKFYTWPSRDVTRTGRCAVVVYWTVWAPMNP